MSTANGTRQRRFWIDPRFAIGIVLIVASVVGVCALLVSQSRSVDVYVARTTLAAGTSVHAGDLELTSVRVPSAALVYLTRSTLPDKAVALRSISKGELVPASALSTRADAELTSVVVRASGPVAAAVAQGATVDVWAARASDEEDYRPPAVLVPGAVVVSVARDDALVADRSAVSIELRVSSSRVAALLQAIADGRVLSVVPASASSGGSAGDLGSSSGSGDDAASPGGDGSASDTSGTGGPGGHSTGTPTGTPTPRAGAGE